ncbi:MAG TPA: hydrogen gas-evolving membrane-bound hydrogenase subunit E [archaeon]|nr:hydrogen gas-evolving membrane-bound hydrogenase subunit E [archaeon]
MNEAMKLSLGFACLAIVSAFLISSLLNPAFNSWGGKKVADFYMSEGWKKLAATNTVTTIVWEFRGYDTLGEETVLFTAAMGVFAMGLYSAERMQENKGKKSASPTSNDDIKKTM